MLANVVLKSPKGREGRETANLSPWNVSRSHNAPDSSRSRTTSKCPQRLAYLAAPCKFESS